MFGLGAFGGNCGIGVQLKKTGDGVVVCALAPGGPAGKSGNLRVDDVIDQVDGKSAGSSVGEVSDKLKGAEGSEIELRLIRPGLFGKEAVRARLKRAPIDQKKPTPNVSPPGVPPRPSPSPSLPSLFGSAASVPAKKSPAATPSPSLGNLFGSASPQKKQQAAPEKNAFDLFGAASPQEKQQGKRPSPPPQTVTGAASAAPAFDIFGGVNALIKDATSLAVGAYATRMHAHTQPMRRLTHVSMATCWIVMITHIYMHTQERGAAVLTATD
jgi:hypothetical protein